MAGRITVTSLNPRMSKCRLKSYEQPIPGGYLFEETFKGIKHTFKEPIIEGTATGLSAFRRGNGIPRSSIKECIEDVDRYQCLRLGNNRTYCTCSDGQTGIIALGTASPIVTPCKGCGAPIRS